ncbi:MAG TPA: DUF305 domain-containing protein [Acidimicrobiia bacterium]|nr:DUF305 domain-containing protein [Acidimicrobiia bacterium]
MPTSLTPARLLALVAALLFLAGVVGYRIGQPDRPGAGSADVGFLQDMIVHHEQAIALSYRTVNEATDFEVRGFAKDILVSQQYEIGLMEAYLGRWGHPRDSGRTLGMAWAGTPHPKGAMIGMATAQELQALERATGPEVDDRFLRLMIAHHHDGVLMGEAVLDRGSDGDVRELATRIVTAQRSEISEMQATRRRLGLPPAEAPAGHPS